MMDRANRVKWKILLLKAVISRCAQSSAPLQL